MLKWFKKFFELDRKYYCEKCGNRYHYWSSGLDIGHGAGYYCKHCRKYIVNYYDYLEKQEKLRPKKIKDLLPNAELKTKYDKFLNLYKQINDIKLCKDFNDSKIVLDNRYEKVLVLLESCINEYRIDKYKISNLFEQEIDEILNDVINTFELSIKRFKDRVKETELNHKSYLQDQLTQFKHENQNYLHDYGIVEKELQKAPPKKQLCESMYDQAVKRYGLIAALHDYRAITDTINGDPEKLRKYIHEQCISKGIIPLYTSIHTIDNKNYLVELTFNSSNKYAIRCHIKDTNLGIDIENCLRELKDELNNYRFKIN